MALKLLAANNAQTVLSAGISSSATTLTVNTGAGALFPAPVSGTSFYKLTLVDAATGQLTEIMHVTERTDDVMTVLRAQEGTTARAWSANDIVANMLTAGTLSYMLDSFQPLNANLTSMSALAGGANKLPYFTGENALALTALTAAGRDLIGKADVAAMQSYLDLESVVLAGVCDGTLSANGYIRIPLVISGAKKTLLIQWGSQSFTPSNTNFYSTITFPTSFPTACVYAGGVGTTTATGGALTSSGAIDIVCCGAKTTTSFLYRIDTNASSPLSGTHAINWIAIGY